MPPKKRKQGSAKQVQRSKKQKQDGQKAVAKDINIPIDEGFKEDGNPLKPNNLDLLLK